MENILFLSKITGMLLGIVSKKALENFVKGGGGGGVGRESQKPTWVQSLFYFTVGGGIFPPPTQCMYRSVER